MSEHAITVVELSLSAAEAAQRAHLARQWLLNTGVIVGNPKPDELWNPCEFLAGPQVQGIACETDVDRRLWNTGVEVLCERQLHHPIENYEPPGCPRCATPLAEDVHTALIETWIEQGEPSTSCGACSHAALLGDWPGQWTYYVAELAVRFNNWPPLTDAFIADLGTHLGPRWRVVYEHA